MWGRAVTINGPRDRVLEGRALLIGDDAPLAGDAVRALGDVPLGKDSA